MKKPNWMNFSRIGAKEYIAAFCITVLLGLLLLVISAFLPQSLIQRHTVESVDLVMQDLQNNFLFDHSKGSEMDVFTDIMILRTSLTTNDRYLGSVLTNPVYTYEGLPVWEGSGKTLAKLAYDQPADGVWFYTRYWMGFRVAVRLALTFLNYAQIKRYLAFLFFSLFAATICSVAKHASSKIAFFFALSIILVRPHIIATSMQFTCCFFIAFAAMLMIPWLYRHGKWEGLFFMEVGMITMYFDFYTVPLLTLGFPLMYLCIVKRENAMQVSYQELLRNGTAWFLGYGLMWVAKLLLTSLLTSENALADGFRSFFSRVGIEKDPNLEQYYSLKEAFEGIRETVFSDEAGALIYLTCAAVILMIVLWKLFRKEVSVKSFRNASLYLFFAAMPIVWFVITKQPVAIHYFFQYRNIALTHWAAGVFLCCLLPTKDRELTKST